MILTYMNRFLKHWRLTERREAFSAHAITYADESLPSIQSNQMGTDAVGEDRRPRQRETAEHY
jgi:hypothetical protein